jgi:hypothetical protein
MIEIQVITTAPYGVLRRIYLEVDLEIRLLRDTLNELWSGSWCLLLPWATHTFILFLLSIRPVLVLLVRSKRVFTRSVFVSMSTVKLHVAFVDPRQTTSMTVPSVQGDFDHCLHIIFLTINLVVLSFCPLGYSILLSPLVYAPQILGCMYGGARFCRGYAYLIEAQSCEVPSSVSPLLRFIHEFLPSDLFVVFRVVYCLLLLDVLDIFTVLHLCKEDNRVLHLFPDFVGWSYWTCPISVSRHL